MAREIFLTKGTGRHREKLTSFEMSLRDAGIAAFNLVRVSSIFPPHCKLIPKSQGLKKLTQGQIVFCVMSEAATNEANRLVAAAVGVAMPRDPKLYGYLSEHHSYGQTEGVAGDYSEDIAAEMLATTLGVDFDPSQDWDEKRELWKISNQIVQTTNITQSATGDKDGLWTTVVAAAVFIPHEG
ncbi:arginine decarboxylase, pyruvoyl-dependent [Acidobacteria bacterium AH-259-D05]|nr:arginine decarboxylase, pyruvoyl-dependent [Acidobacteria bacterium AH-259-D05]